ncbi:mechanosensitive ion channel family protein [uncultured Sphingomonas sp.]|uniref:mechanosensitive ion channel family protein n=1 Tax=uncultured Sphingomonas sp. TaxID=158754 RepID=UPI0025FB17F3|nr:mechanosensitive ion channel family protein [uncultured Sphingomonas sp.]
MSNVTKAAEKTVDKAALNSDAAEAHVRSLWSDGTVWLQTNWLQIAIAVGIGAVIVLLLMVARRMGRKLCDRPDWVGGWGVVFGRTVSKTGNFFIVMVAAKLVEGYAETPPAITTTITFLFTIAAVIQAAVWARELILGGIEHRMTGQDHATLGSAFGLIRLLVTFALFSIALIVVLDNLGVNVTGLVAGLGVGGIAIGLAAQGIFADLFAALAIIFDKPFRVGDAITYSGSSGTVEAIGLKSTRVRGATGELKVISNKKLLDNEILNNTRRDYRRIQFTLGLVQWTAVDVMEALPGMMKEVVEDHGMKFVRAGFTNFGASSYDFGVEFDSPGPNFQDAFDARHVVGLAVIRRLNDEGIELAYPTQTDFTASPDGGLIYPYPRKLASDRPAPPSNISDPIRAQDTHGTAEGTQSAVDQD